MPDRAATVAGGPLEPLELGDPAEELRQHDVARRPAGARPASRARAAGRSPRSPRSGSRTRRRGRAAGRRRDRAPPGARRRSAAPPSTSRPGRTVEQQQPWSASRPGLWHRSAPPDPELSSRHGRTRHGVRRLPRRGPRLLRRPRDGQHQVVLDGAQGRLRHRGQGADDGPGRGPGAGVRQGQAVPALPRRALRQGQDALQDPPGRLRARPARAPAGTSRSAPRACGSASASTTPARRGWPRIRDAIDDDRTGPQLRTIVDRMPRQGWELGGETLKTTPRGYDADHPRIDLLRHKSMTLGKSYGFEPVIHTAELLDRVREDWRAGRAFVEWVDAHATGVTGLRPRALLGSAAGRQPRGRAGPARPAEPGGRPRPRQRLDDGAGHVAQLDVDVLGVAPQQQEGVVGVEPVGHHQRPLGLLDHRPALRHQLHRLVDLAGRRTTHGLGEVDHAAAHAHQGAVLGEVAGAQRDDLAGARPARPRAGATRSAAGRCRGRPARSLLDRGAVLGVLVATGPARRWAPRHRVRTRRCVELLGPGPGSRCCGRSERCRWIPGSTSSHPASDRACTARLTAQPRRDRSRADQPGQCGCQASSDCGARGDRLAAACRPRAPGCVTCSKTSRRLLRAAIQTCWRTSADSL